MNRRKTFGLMLSLAALAGVLTLSAPKSVQACPANETTTTYYSDATLTNVVGERTVLCNCLGTTSWGNRTAYYTVNSISCNELGY